MMTRFGQDNQVVNMQTEIPANGNGSGLPDMNIYDKAWIAVNQGAMAVLVTGLFSYLAIVRGIRSAVKSDLGKALVQTVGQIRENQEHVESLVALNQSQTQLTKDGNKLIDALKTAMETQYEMDSRRHIELVSAIQTLNLVLESQRNKVS